MESGIRATFESIKEIDRRRRLPEFSFHSTPSLALHQAAIKGDILQINKLFQLAPKINIRCLCNRFTPLMYAIQEGHTDAARYIIGLGADVNVRGKDGHTPIILATAAKNFEIILKLINNGALINVFSNDGFTPLLCACQDNDLNMIKFLVSNGADINFASPHYLTPPFQAITNDHIEILQWFIENGAPLSGGMKISLLHFAVYKLKKNVVKFLLDKGANPNQTSNGFTPFHVICEAKDNLDMYNLLVSYGADLNLPDSNGLTPLLLALCNNNTRIASALIHNPMTNIKTTCRLGYSALHIAALKTNVKIVKLLVEKGLDLKEKSKMNQLSPLYLSLKAKNIEIAEYLIAKGADVNEPAPLPYSSLLNRVVSNNFRSDTVELLLKHGADVNDPRNGRPLLTAIDKNFIDLAKLLIKYKTDINATSYLYGSALHVAARKGYVQSCQLLIDNGANVNNDSETHSTPLHAAVMAGNVYVVQLLVKNGADLTVKNKCGKTPLEISLSTENYKQINKILLENGAEYDANEAIISQYTVLQLIDYLFKAVKKDNVERIKTLIKKGVHLNACSKKYGTALIFAAMKGYQDTFDLLLRNKANINATAANTVTALHYAAKFGHFEIACSILKKGGRFDIKSEKSNKTALDFAIEAKHFDIADVLNFVTEVFDFVQKSNFTELSRLLKNINKNRHKLECLFYTQDSSKRTILKIASSNKAKNILELLKSVAPK